MVDVHDRGRAVARAPAGAEALERNRIDSPHVILLTTMRRTAGIAMMRKVGAGFLLVLLPVLGACANSQDEAKSTSSNNTEGVDVEAQQDVWVMSTPGGDVSEGILAQGQTATAVCFLRDIRTSAGFTGNAVKIKTADISGYAFVTDFPTDSADRKMMLSPDEDALGDRLPSCTH